MIAELSREREAERQALLDSATVEHVGALGHERQFESEEPKR